MDSSVSEKDEIWFLRVCHHVPHELYMMKVWAITTSDSQRQEAHELSKLARRVLTQNNSVVLNSKFLLFNEL